MFVHLLSRLSHGSIHLEKEKQSELFIYLFNLGFVSQVALTISSHYCSIKLFNC